jgi:hypothetical protein
MRFFRRSVVSQPFGLAFVRHGGAPFVLKKDDAHKTRFVSAVGFTDVLRIAVSQNYAQIGNSVVGFLPVDMVNQARRPFAVNVKPRKAVRFVDFAADTNSIVSNTLFNAPGYVTRFYGFARPNKPNKYASFRVVTKHFFQVICRKLCVIHKQLPVITMNINLQITAAQA